MEYKYLLTALLKVLGLYTLIWGSVEAIINIVAYTIIDSSRSSEAGFWLVSFGTYSLIGYLLVIKSKAIGDFLIKSDDPK